MLRRKASIRLVEIAAKNGLFAANRARAALSALFSWAIGEGSRHRVLSDAELKLIWQEAGTGQYGAIVRLLILAGQRREEVGGLLWPELNLDKGLWRIDASRTKNGLVHEVPLSDAAVKILAVQTRREERELVFGSSDGPFQGWSNAKTALDNRVLKKLRGEHGDKAKLSPWRLHDIRRTVATRMGDVGVLPHVVEAVLNHISGHSAGVAGVYNRALYAAEKRAALTLWAEHVGALVDGRPSARLEHMESETGGE